MYLNLYLKCALAKDESITLCKAYRVGTHDSNSPDRPRPVKIIRGSVEEKQLLLNRRKVLYSVMPDYFSPELQQGRMVEISGPQRGAAVPQGPWRERPGSQKRSHKSEKVSSLEFSLEHTHYDDGKISENSVLQILFIPLI